MKHLGDTFLYKKTKVNNFTKEVAKINFNTERVDIKEIEENLKIISRRFAYSLKTQAIQNLENDRTICIYPNDNTLTKTLPVFLKSNPKVDGGISAIVNLRLHGTRTKDGYISIDNRTLYGLLEDALIYRYLWLNWGQFEYNTQIMRLSTKIYVKLFNKILDRLFGLNLSPTESDQINYCIGKFFLLGIIEKPASDIVNDLAYSCIFNQSTKNMVIGCDDEFSNEAYLDINEFIGNLRERFPILSKLNMRKFLETWMTMFGDASMFAMEYYPSLLEMVFCGAIIGCRLTAKDSFIDNLVGKDALSLHTEISKLIK
jgi:hypothetical protein